MWSMALSAISMGWNWNISFHAVPGNHGEALWLFGFHFHDFLWQYPAHHFLIPFIIFALQRAVMPPKQQSSSLYRVGDTVYKVRLIWPSPPINLAKTGYTEGTSRTDDPEVNLEDILSVVLHPAFTFPGQLRDGRYLISCTCQPWAAAKKLGFRQYGKVLQSHPFMVTLTMNKYKAHSSLVDPAIAYRVQPLQSTSPGKEVNANQIGCEKNVVPKYRSKQTMKRRVSAHITEGEGKVDPAMCSSRCSKRKCKYLPEETSPCTATSNNSGSDKVILNDINTTQMEIQETGDACDNTSEGKTLRPPEPKNLSSHRLDMSDVTKRKEEHDVQNHSVQDSLSGLRRSKRIKYHKGSPPNTRQTSPRSVSRKRKCPSKVTCPRKDGHLTREDPPSNEDSNRVKKRETVTRNKGKKRINVTPVLPVTETNKVSSRCEEKELESVHRTSRQKQSPMKRITRAQLRGTKLDDTHTIETTSMKKTNADPPRETATPVPNHRSSGQKPPVVEVKEPLLFKTNKINEQNSDDKEESHKRNSPDNKVREHRRHHNLQQLNDKARQRSERCDRSRREVGCYHRDRTLVQQEELQEEAKLQQMARPSLSPGHEAASPHKEADGTEQPKKRRSSLGLVWDIFTTPIISLWKD